MSGSNRHIAPRTTEGAAGPVDEQTRLKGLKFRMLIIGIVLAAGMLAAAGRSLVLQTTYHSELMHEARRNYVNADPIDARRGNVYDRNGALLAVTVNRWAVTADPRFISKKEETAVELGQLLKIPAHKVLERIEPFITTSADRLSTNTAKDAARRTLAPVVKVVSRVLGVPPSRLQRSMALMATFYQMDELQNPVVYQVADAINRAANVVAGMLRANADDFGIFTPRGRKFTYIARDLDDAAILQITEARTLHRERCRKERDAGRRCHNPLGAIHIRPEQKRYYPKREVATQFLGQVARNNRGTGGVERMLDGFLTSGQHRITKVRDRRGRSIYLHGIDPNTPLAPHSVILALDEKIQAHAERIISQACLVAGARAGYAVVMNVKTGEVLAAANFPSYNPNDASAWYASRKPLRNERRAFEQAKKSLNWASEGLLGKLAYPGRQKTVAKEMRWALKEASDAFVEFEHGYPNASRSNAFLDVYEPGSVTKVFTVAAALEEGIIRVDQVFDLENGLFRLHDKDDSEIQDTSPRQSGDVGIIIQKSSNIGTAKIGFLLGAERLERYFRDFGFGGITGSSFPGEAPGTLRPSSKWTRVGLANVAFGQGFSVTGIQLAMALSALANGGKLMRPILVKRVLDENGNVLRRYDPQPIRQVVSPKTARTVLDLMRRVVAPGGTGTRAHIPEYPVAGKTGTGQKPHLKKRGYATDMWVSTFFGIAPADNPELAVVVLVDEPKGTRHGGGVYAAPPFREIMRWSLRHLGIPSPYETSKQVAWVDPHELAKRRKMKRQEGAQAGAYVGLAPPTKQVSQGTVSVPDFSGMTMDQVRDLAYASSLRVGLTGTGIAVKQDVAPNTRILAWSKIRVTFGPRTHVRGGPSASGPRAKGQQLAGGGAL